MESMDQKYRGRLGTHDFICIEDKIYFSALNRNGLYCYNRTNEKTEFITFFKNESFNGKHLHGAVVEKDKKLFFAPMLGKDIAIYDLKNGSIQVINVSEYIEKPGRFYDIIIYKDKIFFIPTRAEYIVSLDTKTEKVEYHKEWLQGINLLKNNEIPMFKNGSFVRKDILYMPFCRENILFAISLQDYTANKIYIGDDKRGFVDAICNDETGDIWLLKNGCVGIVKYNLFSKEYTEYFFQIEDVSCQYPYINMIDMEKYLYLISYQAKKSLRFDKNTNLVSSIDLEEGIDEHVLKEWGANHYFAKKLNNLEFVVAKTGDYSVEIVDVEGNIKKSFSLSDDGIELRKFLYENTIMKEYSQDSLEKYIQLEIGQNDNRSNILDVGRKVHEHIRDGRFLKEEICNGR